MTGEQNPMLPRPPTSTGPPTTSVPSVAGTLVAAPFHLISSDSPDHSPAAPSARSRAPTDLAPYDAISPWRPWPAVGIVVLIVALSLVAAMIVALITEVIPQLQASVTPVAPRPFGGIIALVVMLTAQLGMAGGAVLAARAWGGHVVQTLALKAPAGGAWTYVKALIVALAAVAVYTVVTQVIFGQDMGADMSSAADMMRGPSWPLALFVIGVGAPVSEEFLFRGFLQSSLVASRLGYWGASVVTTTLWTALHAGYSIAGLIEVFMIGMIFTLYLRRTGSLRVSLFCHAAYNSMIALVLIFASKETLGF